MLGDGNFGWLLLAAFGVVMLAWLAMRFYTTRLSRRRRKSHSPIVSKSRHPTVKFSVNPQDQKPGDRKRRK